MSKPKPSLNLSEDLEARHLSVMRGIKQGALKGMVDKLVDSMSGPISESIVKNLSDNHPSLEVLEPAVKAALSFIVIMGIAELINVAAPMTGKTLPGLTEDNAAEKGKLLARWMREYAGEKVGSQVVEAGLQVFPLVMAHFSEIDTQDLKFVLDVDGDTPADKVETESENIKIEV
jgi:hypothetical protein